MRDEPKPVAGPPRIIAGHWQLVLLLMAICYLAHFNRVSMAVAADSGLMQRYALSPAQMGSIYSAFLAAYTLLMIPGGWLIDRRGPGFSLMLVCIGSAVFVVLTGCVGMTSLSAAMALPAFLVIRATMGAVSAPLHPAAACAISREFAPGARSAANGMVTGAALLGVASTYVLFGDMVDQVDWPASFVIAGVVTAVCGALWWAYSRHKRELEAAPLAPAQSTNAGSSRVSARKPLERGFRRRNRNLILLTFSYGAVGYFQYLFFYWIPYYFQIVLGLETSAARFYSTIPPSAMALGMLLGGWLSDRIELRAGQRLGRAGLVSLAMTASALLLAVGMLITEPTWKIGWLSLALGVLGLAEGAFWATAVEVGRQRGGLSASIVNTGGNAGGALAPWLTPLVGDSWGFGWQVGIGLGSAVCLLGAAAWYWIDLRPQLDSDAKGTAVSLQELVGTRVNP